MVACGAAGALLTASAIADALWLSAPLGPSLANIALLSASVLLATLLAIEHGDFAGSASQFAGAFIGGLLLLNALLPISFTGDPIFTFGPIFLVIGFGFVFFDGSWLAACIAITLFGWSTLAYRIGSAAMWTPYALGLTGAALVALVVFRLRVGAFDRVDGLARDAEASRAKLQAAVILAELEIDQRRETESELRESRNRYDILATVSPVGIFHTDEQGHCRYVNDYWREITGRVTPHTGLWTDCVHPDDRQRVIADWSESVSADTPFRSEFRLLRDDAPVPWVLCRTMSQKAEDGRVTGHTGAMTDVTDRKHVEQRLIHDAFHDDLTGLPNRALFLERLESAIETAKRNDRAVHVLFLDMDRFKVINDSLGHMVGDRLLQAVARRVGNCLRRGDTPARLGGDEFAILLSTATASTLVEQIAERLQEELSHPFMLDGHEVYASASIGIASLSGHAQRPEDLLRNADIAMYSAKDSGKARCAMFDTAMHTHTVERLDFETDLRRAIDRRELDVHYQPIVSVETGRISGFEALARWKHRERGMVPPAEFIASAEETGLIVDLGDWVLRTACRQMSDWHRRFSDRARPQISVNLSSRQFSQGNLVDSVAEILDTTGLDPNSLGLEITETIIMHNVDSVTGMLQRLRDLGIELSIDDFGTGYSSLSYLHGFPLDRLKIDRSFVARLGVAGGQPQIVRSIIDLGKNLNMAVVAEGVETPDQLACLRELGCQYVQGYYLAKPLDKDATEAMIASDRTW